MRTIDKQLLNAVEKANPERVYKLIHEKGANPSLVLDDGSYLINFAINHHKDKDGYVVGVDCFNWSAVIKILIQAGCRVDDEDNGCISDLAHYGRPDLIRAFNGVIDHNEFSYIAKDLIDSTILSYQNGVKKEVYGLCSTRWKDWFECLELLCELGAELDSKENRQILVSAMRMDKGLFLVTWLVERGAPINPSLDDEYIRPLPNAVSENLTDIALYLIEQGADVHKCYPLGFACENKNIEIATALLDRGAIPRAKDKKFVEKIYLNRKLSNKLSSSEKTKLVKI